MENGADEAQPGSPKKASVPSHWVHKNKKKKQDSSTKKQLGSPKDATKFFESEIRAKSRLNRYIRSKEFVRATAGLEKRIATGTVSTRAFEEDEEPEEPEVKKPVVAEELPSSWVASLRTFSKQRQQAEENYLEGEADGDLELYTDDQQQMRWHVRHDREFLECARTLWDLARGDGELLSKEKYLRMIVGFHHVVYFGVDSDAVLASAECDWEKDAKGRENISFKVFFDAIFQCVDIWTESVDLEEYVALAQRFIEGCSEMCEDGKRRWRAKSNYYLANEHVAVVEIQRLWRGQKARPKQLKCQLKGEAAVHKWKLEHDRKKALRDLAKFKKVRAALTIQSLSRGFIARQETESTLVMRQFEMAYQITPFAVRSAIATRRIQAATRGILARMGIRTKWVASKPKKKMRRGSSTSSARWAAQYVSRYKVEDPQPFSKDMRLSPEETCRQIARIYQSFVLAHYSRRSTALLRELRVDAFVLRYFRQMSGSAALARGHLAVFSASVMEGIGEETTTTNTFSSYARCALFAKVSGLNKKSGIDVENTFDARLMPEYVMPVLVSLYGAAIHLIAKRLRNHPVARRGDLEKAIRSVLVNLREPDLLEELGPIIRDLYSASLKEQEDEQLVDVDEALWAALPLYERGEAYMATRRAVAARLATKTAQKFRERRRKSLLKKQQMSSPSLSSTEETPHPLLMSASSPRMAMAEAQRRDQELNPSDDSPAGSSLAD